AHRDGPALPGSDRLRPGGPGAARRDDVLNDRPAGVAEDLLRSLYSPGPIFSMNRGRPFMRLRFMTTAAASPALATGAATLAARPSRRGSGPMRSCSRPRST